MKKYFIEIEFKTKTEKENKYWIPLFIEADSESEANEVKTRIKVAFEEKYTLIKMSSPKLYVEGLNSNYINEYVEKKMYGKISVLKIDVWEIKNIELTEEIPFDEGIQMIDIEYALKQEDKQVAKTIARYEFPVRVLHKNQDLNDIKNEVHLINVVAPTFVNKLIGAFKNRRK